MGLCKDEMKKLIKGEVDEVNIIAEFESMESISTSVQVWKYDDEKDIISYCTLTKSNSNRPYFIKIKNGKNFVDKKYIGESLADDTKLKLVSKEEALDILEKLKLQEELV
ncbi:MAG: hypothetical protein ACRC3Y_11145 [Romboutsia sp.]|uniref:hypothetical protein n=1 Tax=Romboutsia sp. TaxID=1965302 RepID=UPI003F3FCAB0